MKLHTDVSFTEKQMIKAYAHAKGITVGEVLRRALNDYLPERIGVNIFRGRKSHEETVTARCPRVRVHVTGSRPVQDEGDAALQAADQNLTFKDHRD